MSSVCKGAIIGGNCICCMKVQLDSIYMSFTLELLNGPVCIFLNRKRNAIHLGYVDVIVFLRKGHSISSICKQGVVVVYSLMYECIIVCMYKCVI